MKAILNQFKFLLTGRQQLQSLREEHDKKFELLQSENHCRVVDIEELGREVQGLTTSVKELDTSMGELQNAMGELQNAMGDLRERRLFGDKETREVLDEVSRRLNRLNSRLLELESGSRSTLRQIVGEAPMRDD
jgi:chromosome segregation ATPase